MYVHSFLPVNLDDVNWGGVKNMLRYDDILNISIMGNVLQHLSKNAILNNAQSNQNSMNMFFGESID
jgi:hypothetical protein